MGTRILVTVRESLRVRSKGYKTEIGDRMKDAAAASHHKPRIEDSSGAGKASN